jgi:1-acyl-sn-glycerol-3-phosphate acyltransferase
MGYAYSKGWRGLSIIAIRPAVSVLSKRDWRGGSNIPRTGGLIIAANHISESDPIPIAHFLYANGRYPVYLAKAALFRRGFAGKVMRETGQIPVDRGGPEAAIALDRAQAALAAGQCVVIYPEGTCTRDPDLWPMAGRTGVARLALATGVPVIPLASWGAHELFPYRKGERGGLAESLKPGLHLLPPKKMQVVTGPPLDLANYASQPLTATVVRAATSHVMRAITHLLEELREEHAPTHIYESHESH